MSSQIQVNGTKITVSDSGEVFKNGHKMVEESFQKKESSTVTDFEKGSVANNSSVLKKINVALKSKKLDNTVQHLKNFGISFSLDGSGRLKSIDLNEENRKDRNVIIDGDVESISHSGAGNIYVAGDVETIRHNGAGNIRVSGDSENVSHYGQGNVN